MGGCLFMLAIACFVIGFVQLIAPESKARPAYAGRPPVRYRRAAAPVPPQQPAQGSFAGGERMVGSPQKLNWIRVGQRIFYNHPVKGEVMAHVMGRILYAELWQTRRGPQSPWVPTGNAFLGFWLEGGVFLLNWQTRFYLLDEMVQLSDAEIQRDFLPHARKFAQSDQTAEVVFSYPPAVWKMDDIGKFRVEETEGEGLVFRMGAVGRFIHASGSDQRALVVEDYEGGGGGQDTAWTGYQIEEKDIRPES